MGTFRKELLWRILLDVLLVAVVAVMGFWLNPLQAESTLRRQNYLNSKRDAYYEAVDVMMRWMGAVDISPAPSWRVPQGTIPTERDVNLAKAKLVLFMDKEEVVAQFDSFFASSANTIRTFGQFVKLARMDMGYADWQLLGKYKYLFVNPQPRLDSNEQRRPSPRHED